MSVPVFRFAPSPNGYLHLGHALSALINFDMARAVGGRLLLRIEDIDRARCRPEYEAAIYEDLAWLGFAADRGPVRHTDDDTPYQRAVDDLTAQRLVYGCDCTRLTFSAWAESAGRPWSGGGCPGGCRERDLSIDRALTETTARRQSGVPQDGRDKRE